MNEAEKLLEKFARKNMVRWNQESFKRTHSRLHKSIIEALNEALRIHDVVWQSEQLLCDCGNSSMTWYGNDDDKKWFCSNCKKEVK